MKIPIIILHIGKSNYVESCMKQALKYNNEVIFLTDDSNYLNNFKIKVVDYTKYVKYGVQLQKTFKNYSTNSPQIEFLCVLRWLVVYQYMKENNINRAFICDSDVLIYDDISELNEKYLKDYNFMLCSSPSKNLTGGQSIWNIEELGKFKDFVINFYGTQINNIESFFETYKEPGGICDMTILYYFAHNKSNFEGLRFDGMPYFNQDLTQIFNDELTFDLHLDTAGNHPNPNDWEMVDGRKNIKYINNQPHCYNKRLKKDIRFVLLHFQGRNKRVMTNWFEKTN